jgi:hypothetical protein
LHPAVTGSGVEPGTPGLVTVEGPVMVSVPTVVSGVSGVVAGPAPVVAANVLPAALVEQVFGNLEQTGVVGPDGTNLQPGVILNTEGSDRGSGVRDLAMMQAQPGTAGTEWLTDESLSYLGQSGRGLLLTGGVMDDGTVQDGDDLSALDAVFAKESSGKFRLQ